MVGCIDVILQWCSTANLDQEPVNGRVRYRHALYSNLYRRRFNNRGIYFVFEDSKIHSSIFLYLFAVESILFYSIQSSRTRSGVSFNPSSTELYLAVMIRNR